MTSDFLFFLNFTRLQPSEIYKNKTSRVNYSLNAGPSSNYHLHVFFFISIPPLSIIGYLFGVKVKHNFRLTFQKVKHSRVHLFAGGMGKGLLKNKVPHKKNLPFKMYKKKVLKRQPKRQKKMWFLENFRLRRKKAKNF